MAMIDKLNTFCTAMALTDSDELFTDVIDLKAAGLLGTGKPLQVVINVDVAADATTGNETYVFNVITDDVATCDSGTTIATKTILAAALAVNTLHVIDIPEGVATLQYLGVKFDGGGTSPLITVTAWLAEKGSVPTSPTLGKFANGWDA
jgi:hypothetical protein